jgi:hypothetical protein
MTMAKEPTAAVAIRRENLPAPVTTFDDIQKLGMILSKSCMFGAKTDEEGLVIAMTCVMEKMTPLEFSQTYHVIDKKLAMRADAMLAALLEAGGEYKIIRRDSEGASVSMKCGTREGTFTLTHEQVKLEPFYWNKEHSAPKDNYATPHKRMQMLWARVTSDGCRTVNPGGVKGTYTPEEVGDFTEDDRVTRAKVVTPEAVSEALQTPQPATAPAAAKAEKPAAKTKPAPKTEKIEQVTPEVLPPVDKPSPTTPAAPGVDCTVMPFGKQYKGKKFADMPADALKSVVAQPMVSDAEVETAKAKVEDAKKTDDKAALDAANLEYARAYSLNKLTQAHRDEARKALAEKAQVAT